MFERHNKSFKRVIMLLKRVNNLCAQDKKRKENVPSGVLYSTKLMPCFKTLREIHPCYTVDLNTTLYKLSSCNKISCMGQLMRLWYLSHRRSAKVSLCIHALSAEPSLFVHTKYGSRRRVWSKLRHLAPLDGCACAIEEWVYGGRKEP